MKFLVLFASLVAFAVGSAIPLIPKDNSHYVEGESRYVWVTKGKGDMLVDLHEAVDEDLESVERRVGSIQYWLFTNQNPTTRQIIRYGQPQTIWASNYVASRPLKIIIHGYTDNGNAATNTMLTSAWLSVMNVNIIVVDWRVLASGSYMNAIRQTPAMGRAVGAFITWLIGTAGGNWNNVHITGFSLGGQIAGNAGRACGGRIRRYTGLDPVSPIWYNNNNAAGRNDALYVEMIHTHYTRGNSPLIGHADFYPNGGSEQPGCISNFCSHTRAYHLFASSIRTNHFVGRMCNNVWEAENNRCTGANFNMGNSILSKRGNGFFGLTTLDTWPF